MQNSTKVLDKPNVKAEHPEYVEFKDRWSFTRNVVNDKVRDYIKDIEDMSSITEQMASPRQIAYYQSRNTRYKDDATFVNFTRRTKNTWIGSIFRKPPVI